MINPQRILNKSLPKRMFRKNDRDGDGKKNERDCQPGNVMRQDGYKIGDIIRFASEFNENLKGKIIRKTNYPLYGYIVDVNGKEYTVYEQAIKGKI